MYTGKKENILLVVNGKIYKVKFHNIECKLSLECRPTTTPLEG
ncbi:hypothetical protein [Thermococcus camini]|nr:hypothetical protein [Thermococcus camini]